MLVKSEQILTQAKTHKTYPKTHTTDQNGSAGDH